MRTMRVVPVFLLLASAVLVAALTAGCGGETIEATGWVAVAEEVGQDLPYPNVDSSSTAPFELTGAPCRLRYETQYARALRVYLVPQNEPTKAQSVLDMQILSAKSGEGETAISAEPGTYYLEIEGLSSTFGYHLWVEEQR